MLIQLDQLQFMFMFFEIYVFHFQLYVLINTEIFLLQVILLNQVTTKYSEGSFQLTLALGMSQMNFYARLLYIYFSNVLCNSRGTGDSWSHACTNRIILYWNGNERYAFIEKSPSIRSASSPYSVTGRGIRNSASNCKRVKMM